VDLAEAWGKKVKGDVIRIILDLFTGKGFGTSWWSSLTLVFPCKVYRAYSFIKYLALRYKMGSCF